MSQDDDVVDLFNGSAELRAFFNIPTPEPGHWPLWRINRLVEILDQKAQGKTNTEAGKAVGVSKNTVSRELNSPHARDIGQRMLKRVTGMMWSLTERQLKQIETGGLSPTAQVIYRGRLINTLASLTPKHIETKVTGEFTGEIKREPISETALEEYIGVIVNVASSAVFNETHARLDEDALLEDTE